MSAIKIIKLSEQEQKILNFLKDKDRVAWEHLAQFSKDPTSVKRKTLLKVVSDLRKKYKDMGLPDPITCQFFNIAEVSNNKTESSSQRTFPAEIMSPPTVQMRKTLGGNLVRADDKATDVYHDFKLDKLTKKVKTKNGWIALSESNFELFEIFCKNAGRALSKEELKNLVWPLAGSKVPASWWSNLSGRMTGLRTCLPELKTRLTRIVMGGDSSFMLR